MKPIKADFKLNLPSIHVPKVRSRSFKVALFLALAIVVLLAGTPSNPNPQSSMVAPSPSVVLPSMPKGLDFGSWQKTWQQFVDWINYCNQETYRWFAGQGYLIPRVYATTNFGVTSTGSTSYPTTTDTIGASNTLTEAISINYLVGYAITASASGTLSTLGFRAVSVTGSPHLNLALYSTYNSSKFSGLKCSTGSQIPVNGWNDWSCSGGTITATTTYYISYDGDSTNEGHYYAAGGTQYYVALAYASFPPDPSATLSSNSYTITMRMTYSQIKGYTKGTRVQYTGTTCVTGCVSSFSFYVTNYSSGDKIVLAFYSDVAGAPTLELWNSNTAGTDPGATGWAVILESSGTVDNAWADTLVNGSYYWFMWQWNSTDAGPSYAAGAANTGIYKAQTYGTLDSTWSAGTLSTENWSMYLTYSGYTTTFTSTLFSTFTTTTTSSSGTNTFATTTPTTSTSGTTTITSTTTSSSGTSIIAPFTSTSTSGTSTINTTTPTTSTSGTTTIQGLTTSTGTSTSGTTTYGGTAVSENFDGFVGLGSWWAESNTNANFSDGIVTDTYRSSPNAYRLYFGDYQDMPDGAYGKISMTIYPTDTSGSIQPKIDSYDPVGNGVVYLQEYINGVQCVSVLLEDMPSFGTWAFESCGFSGLTIGTGYTYYIELISVGHDGTHQYHRGFLIDDIDYNNCYYLLTPITTTTSGTTTPIVITTSTFGTTTINPLTTTATSSTTTLAPFTSTTTSTLGTTIIVSTTTTSSGTSTLAPFTSTSTSGTTTLAPFTSTTTTTSGASVIISTTTTTSGSTVIISTTTSTSGTTILVSSSTTTSGTTTITSSTVSSSGTTTKAPFTSTSTSGTSIINPLTTTSTSGTTTVAPFTSTSTSGTSTASSFTSTSTSATISITVTSTTTTTSGTTTITTTSTSTSGTTTYPTTLSKIVTTTTTSGTLTSTSGTSSFTTTSPTTTITSTSNGGTSTQTITLFTTATTTTTSGTLLSTSGTTTIKTTTPVNTVVTTSTSGTLTSTFYYMTTWTSTSTSSTQYFLSTNTSTTTTSTSYQLTTLTSTFTTSTFFYPITSTITTTTNTSYHATVITFLSTTSTSYHATTITSTGSTSETSTILSYFATTITMTSTWYLMWLFTPTGEPTLIWILIAVGFAVVLSFMFFMFMRKRRGGGIG